MVSYLKHIITLLGLIEEKEAHQEDPILKKIVDTVTPWLARATPYQASYILNHLKWREDILIMMQHHPPLASCREAFQALSQGEDVLENMTLIQTHLKRIKPFLSKSDLAHWATLEKECVKYVALSMIQPSEVEDYTLFELDEDTVKVKAKWKTVPTLVLLLDKIEAHEQHMRDLRVAMGKLYFSLLTSDKKPPST